jgi:DNA-binding MurR/RpiR family transcriptional regulator
MEAIMEYNEDFVSHAYLIKHQSVYSSLKTAEKKAAEYCLNNPGRVVNAAISDIASEAGCSEATLVRFARRMGYSGFPELRMMIMNRSVDRIYPYEVVAKQDTISSIVEKVFQASIQALIDTRMMLVTKEIQRTVDSLSRAGNIVFCGAGDANLVAMSGFQKFARLGFQAEFALDFDTQLLHASQLKKGDVLFCISHSGRTKSLLTLQKIARKNEATIVSITNFPSSPVAKASDIVLLTATYTQNAMGEGMTKRVAELCILEAIYVAVYADEEKKKQRTLQRADQALLLNKA